MALLTFRIIFRSFPLHSWFRTPWILTGITLLTFFMASDAVPSVSHGALAVPAAQAGEMRTGPPGSLVKADKPVVQAAPVTLVTMVAVARTPVARSAQAQAEKVLHAEKWNWPLSPTPEIVRRFEPPPQKWLAGHRGVDLQATPDQEVHSPAPATVWFSGVVAGRPVISLQHSGGILTSYEPVDSGLHKGDVVDRGAAIGHLWGGDAKAFHCATPCLHWGARKDGEYFDPLSLIIDMRPSVLLPWKGE